MLFALYLQYFHIFLAVVFVWPRNQTRDVHALVRPDDITTRISPKDICNNQKEASQQDGTKENSESILLLVVVCSSVQNFKERQKIRETWAKDQADIPDARVIFMLGNSFNETLQPNVTREAEIFGDILQESFQDSYANLTVKSLMLLKWFTTSCNGKYLPY